MAAELKQRSTTATKDAQAAPKEEFADANIPDDYVSRVLATEKPLPPFSSRTFSARSSGSRSWLSPSRPSSPSTALHHQLEQVHRRLDFRLLLPHWSRHHRRLPPSLGPPCLQRIAPAPVLPGLHGLGCRPGLHPLVGRGHRAHHRYTDTDLDPYGAHFGLFWSHLGWMLIKPRRKPGVADISDLRKNPVIKFQHKFYIPMLLFFGFGLPTLVAGLGWGDWRGGFFFAGMLRLFFVHHSPSASTRLHTTSARPPLTTR